MYLAHGRSSVNAEANAEGLAGSAASYSAMNLTSCLSGLHTASGFGDVKDLLT